MSPYLTYAGGALPAELSRLLSDSGVIDGGGRNGGAPSSLVELSGAGGMPVSEKFLRSFCRYCHSHPFYCGEMLQLCYSRARTVYL